jgi:hypothetical protein
VNPKLVQQHLAQAERHVFEGERRIACQRQIVAELERDGKESWDATELLCRLEELQALHVVYR